MRTCVTDASYPSAFGVGVYDQVFAPSFENSTSSTVLANESNVKESPLDGEPCTNAIGPDPEAPASVNIIAVFAGIVSVTTSESGSTGPLPRLLTRTAYN